MDTFTLSSSQTLGSLQTVQEPSLLEDSRSYTASEANAGLEYRFQPGYLTQFTYLTADFLLLSDRLAVLKIQLQEGEDGPCFDFSFGLLNRCQARLRMPLESAGMNTWMYPREGALLKPLTWGERVDLAKVDRLRLLLSRSGGKAVRWQMTNLTATTAAPALLESPLLPSGPLLDELGQSTLLDWPGKTRDAAELVARLKSQQAAAADQQWPASFSRWGGWAGKQGQATGFFRTEFDGNRWWLVDPDGHPFWSSGLACVGMNINSAVTGIETALSWKPEVGGPYAPAIENDYFDTPSVNYLIANFIRAFAADWRERWGEIALSLLRGFGINTVANWSDWRVASRAGFPYVRPLHESFRRSRLVYRSFPDIFHPDFDLDVVEYAQQLAETRTDPALIGYFLMNEPAWGFSSETLAEGMLYTTPQCASRLALADFLRERYPDDAVLSAAWNMPARLADVAEGEWTARLTPEARADLASFSTRMVEKYFGALNAACKQVDPNHLNLGARYYTVPPEWVLRGMHGFDVFSINCYRSQVPDEDLGRIHDLLGLPTLVGEWHFGALDVGLPGSGIGHVPDQTARGQAYRVYVENAAAIPWCVGVHYFTLYDQSALGRFDGENYNIGFVDVCHRPYEPLADAARQVHERLYAVAAGELEPYDERPEYLPMLFL
ncbi:MAG: hypothetical protein EHM21_06260 [Chloroflexi bacterium]|nr:MAG: hypothetical protein EHM21_06260 [Chloroflexota bacterium]